jgi:DNA-binding response OmpR family regulator
MAKNKKILLAEDDKFIARAYKDGLTEAGYEVVRVKDGKQAWDKLKNSDFDLLLLDIIMPQKDGFEILEGLKEEGRDELPVIVISNLGQDSDIKKAKKLGADDYLVKSNYAMKEVLEKVEAQIG